MRLSERLALVSRVAFGVSWLFACLTPSWSRGIYSKLPLFTVMFRGNTQALGIAFLLPIVAGTSWLASYIATPDRRWNWGQPSITVPIIAVVAFGLLRSFPIHRTTTFISVCVSSLITLGIYFYGLQNWPSKSIFRLFSAYLAIQGSVALLQFVQQSSLGIDVFGERVLDPTMRGISVVEVAGQRWLRGYGLAPHPNPLGGFLATGLLICTGAWLETPRERWYLLIGIVPGLAGLLVTFSRASWLAMFIGSVYLATSSHIWRNVRWRRAHVWALAGILLLVVLVAVFMGPIFMQRVWRLDSTLERNSINERLRDARQALMLIRMRPLDGVGTGYYVDSLWAWANATGRNYPAFQDAHSSLLLASAEMGLVGGLVWLWFLVGPVIAVRFRTEGHDISLRDLVWLGGFAVLIVVGMLDHYLYFFHTWWSSLYLGALYVGWADASEGR